MPGETKKEGPGKAWDMSKRGVHWEQEMGEFMFSRAGYDCAVVDGGAVDRDQGQGTQWSLEFCPIGSFLKISMS